MIRFVLLFLLTSSVACELIAQENPYTDSLTRNLESASSAAEKVKWLGQLSQFYFSVDKKKSDEYNQRQFQLAETSRDRKLIVLAYLSDARRHFNMGGHQQNLNEGLKLAEKALAMAKASSLEAEQAWSYIYLAAGSRLNSEYDNALNYNNQAVSLLTTLEDDSLSVIGYSSLGNSYLYKNEKMLAFRNYLQALRIAEQTDNYFLLRTCYTTMSQFYSSLDEYEKAKDYAYLWLALTYKYHHPVERLDVYNSIGRIYARSKQYDMALEFYEKSIALADTLKFELVKINAYSNILDVYASTNRAVEALEFFNSKKALKEFMLNAGFDHFIDQAYGVAYTSMKKFDSAGYYFRKAEPGFETKASRGNRIWFYHNWANYYKKKGDYKNALVYFKRVETLSEETEDLEIIKLANKNLDSVYQKLGDYKSAYLHNAKYQSIADSLETLSAEKDLMLMEVDNENKRRERLALQAEEEKRTWHNIQYMGITAAIAGVFILLVMLGMFSVSRTTIRILGFFAFIFLFEFIILLADNQIHHWTHGEPWKILAIKIGLISILLPLHHFMEEKVIHYLTSRKMLELNKNGFLSKFISKKDSESSTIES
jgi:tetratricopeptide (TPR) repeat protein